MQNFSGLCANINKILFEDKGLVECFVAFKNFGYALCVFNKKWHYLFCSIATDLLEEIDCVYLFAKENNLQIKNMCLKDCIYEKTESAECILKNALFLLQKKAVDQKLKFDLLSFDIKQQFLQNNKRHIQIVKDLLKEIEK